MLEHLVSMLSVSCQRSVAIALRRISSSASIPLHSFATRHKYAAMVFSGQYAAAQLQKLDHSPLFRGLWFPLSHELSEYLGYAPNFAPPSFVEWAQAHGRLPSIVKHLPVGFVDVPMLEHEFEREFAGYEVRANIIVPRGILDGMLRKVSYTGRFERIRELTTGYVLFGICIELEVGDEDADFYSRWLRVHSVAWPFGLRENRIHPVIQGAVKIFMLHNIAWLTLSHEQTMIMYRRNRSLEV